MFICKNYLKSKHFMQIGNCSDCIFQWKLYFFLGKHWRSLNLLVLELQCLLHVAKSYNLAVYFEANGHGTVTSDEEFNKMLANATGKHAEKLRAFLAIVNAMLEMESRICCLQKPFYWRKNGIWRIGTHFTQNCQKKQTKLTVKDKKAFIATNADRQLIQHVEVTTFYWWMHC